MDRRNWTKVFAALVIVYIVIWAAVCVWEVRLSRSSGWLVEKEADPTVKSIPFISENDWVAKLATSNFASKLQGERVTIADQQFEKIKNLANEQGYDLKALHAWYQQTAIDFERYPVKTFVFSQGVRNYYRDLRESGFPIPSSWRLFWRAFLSKDAMLLALIGLPFVTLIVLFIIGVFVALFSRSLALKWRALVLALIAVILVEAWFIRDAQKRPVRLGGYNFYDAGDYISVKGTWTSDAKLAAPLQVTQLECWQRLNQCIEATAEIIEGFLHLNTSYWDIANWGKDELTIEDNDLSICSIERLRVDRKGKIVTATSAAKQPKPDSCSRLPDEPVVSHIADGIKLQFEQR